MIRIRHSLEIDREVGDVFAYVADLENMPEWGTSASVTKISDGPISAGTRYREVARFRGRTIELDDEVIEYEPNRTFTVRTTSPMLVSTSRTRFSSTSDRGGTRLDYEVEAEPQGFVRLLASLLKPRIEKQFVADVANLKRMLETGTVDHASA